MIPRKPPSNCYIIQNTSFSVTESQIITCLDLSVLAFLLTGNLKIRLSMPSNGPCQGVRRAAASESHRFDDALHQECRDYQPNEPTVPPTLPLDGPKFQPGIEPEIRFVRRQFCFQLNIRFFVTRYSVVACRALRFRSKPLSNQVLLESS